MTYDLIIRGGDVVLDRGIERLDIGIADGTITTFGQELEGRARSDIDARGLHVLPGAIDTHVHFNEPGRAHWEGFATGSAALVVGGGTCFFDMPLNADPPTTTAEAFQAKHAAAAGQCSADFGLWGGITPDNTDELEALAHCGVVGFKAFMADSGIPDFPAVDDSALLDGMTCAASLGLPVAVHAEDESVIRDRRAATFGSDGRAYAASRPVEAEIAAIRRAIDLAAEAGCSLHIVHVSSAAGVAEVASARARGVDVTCETCAHYLCFSEDDVERLGVIAKCAPPLRPSAEPERLWTLIGEGVVDFIASDHSPSPPEMKQSSDFFEAWGGIAGCQSTLPAMLVEGRQRRGMPLSTVAALLAAAPAARYRIARKGRIAEGMDADLVLVDLTAAEPLRAEDLQYRHRASPYVGLQLHGVVRRTLLRGHTVALGGRPTGLRPGRLVRPIQDEHLRSRPA